MSHKIALKCLFALLLGVTACCANAEENRYMHLIEGGIVYRFDNVNGEVYRLVKSQTGQAMWVKCDVVEPKAIAKAPANIPIPLLTNTPPAVAAIQRPNNVTPFPPVEQIQPVASHSTAYGPASMLDSGDAIAGDPAPRKAALRRIELFDEFDHPITDLIDDSMRTLSRPTINGYDKLNVSHTLKTNGDRITGLVIIDNKGDKKIERMELTMFVRVIGKDKPIEHQRFVFDVNGAEKPPVASNGASGLGVLKKIDLPTPSGVIQGMPEVRVTYLKFEGEQP